MEGAQVRLQNLLLKFVYQGHQVKVKVTGAKRVSVYPVRGCMVCLGLKGSFVCTLCSREPISVGSTCVPDQHYQDLSPYWGLI